MNFRKVRKRRQHEHVVRSWERGFLSADCGDTAPDDIGYLPLYKPDIDGRENALCDYVFNETVLVYSHDNARNVHHMVGDYLNVFASLWLAGDAPFASEVSLFNIDGLNARSGGGKGRAIYTGDQITQLFR